MVNPVNAYNEKAMPLGKLGGNRKAIIENQLYIKFNEEKTVARIHDLGTRLVYEFSEINKKANAQLLTQYLTKIATDTEVNDVTVKQSVDDFFNELDSNEKKTEMASMPELFNKKAEEGAERTGKSCKAVLIALFVIGIAAMIIGGILCSYPNLLPVGISLVVGIGVLLTIASVALSMRSYRIANGRLQS